jgi:alpha-mannosidase
MSFYNKFITKKLSVRSLNEMRLSIFDHLSPRYDHHHTTDEVTGWFSAFGFVGLKKTFQNHNAFGFVATLEEKEGD